MSTIIKRGFSRSERRCSDTERVEKREPEEPLNLFGIG